MMANNEIDSLREWAPMTDVFEKIPARIARGIFPVDLNITCVDVVLEFIALGSDAGIVFWYNRQNGDVLKLRAEISSPITCIKIVSSVEYMVAAGCANGQVNVFQIQKQHPPDLDLLTPLTKPKPIQRYTIRDLHQPSVTCCEWSKNGMKLFSGDKRGVVVFTEFDYQMHLSKSVEILNEAYDIVQLTFNQSYLLVSTVYRTIICQKLTIGKWAISQVGKTDRKVLSNFGATFLKDNLQKSTFKIICSRPGLRIWIANNEGTVKQTLIFKDALQSYLSREIPLLNPSRNQQKDLSHFGVIKIYMNKYVVTNDENSLYILNLEMLRIEAVARGFRKIISFCIFDKEIIILEGSRSIIRLAPTPEPPNKTAKIIFNPLMPPPVPPSPTYYKSPLEYEAESESVMHAEECFEMLPIEHLGLKERDELDSPRTEQNKRIEIFNQIGEMEFDDSILYRPSGKRLANKKKTSGGLSVGIVEIGQAPDEKLINKGGLSLELTTKPTNLDFSFCSDSASIIHTDPMSPNTLQRVLEPKEKALAEELHLHTVHLEEISQEQLNKSKNQVQPNMPTWQYTKTYPIPRLEDAEVQTTPRKKLHFINDDYISSYIGETAELQHSECSTEPKPALKFIASQPVEVTDTAPAVVDLPEFMKIPPLWNSCVEILDNAPDSSSSTTSSEWEFLGN